MIIRRKWLLLNSSILNDVNCDRKVVMLGEIWGWHRNMTFAKWNYIILLFCFPVIIITHIWFEMPIFTLQRNWPLSWPLIGCNLPTGSSQLQNQSNCWLCCCREGTMEHVGDIQMTGANNMTLRLISNDNNWKVCAEAVLLVVLVVSLPVSHDRIPRNRVQWKSQPTYPAKGMISILGSVEIPTQ